jgi:N-methylhydantoinase B
MPEAVDAVLALGVGEGDVWCLNDPFAGGTHLPDVTLVAPVDHGGRRLGYTVSRAHHADVGGLAPGSMPAGSRTLREEGLVIPPVRIVRGGEPVTALVEALVANMRRPDERRADLRAQLACHAVANWRLAALAERHGPEALEAACDHAQEHGERRVRAALAAIPDGVYRAEDVLEGDGTHDDDIPIRVVATIAGDTLELDFTGSAPQQPGNVNCPLAVTRSACLYALRVATDPDVPTSAGAARPLRIVAPGGLVVHARPGAAVAAGNVETSNRIADVVLAALGQALPLQAQGQGTMNNVVLGTPRWTSYETIGGGQGACAGADGPSGVHVSMSNTLNTPVEAFELGFPVLVEAYGLRRGSGGAGRHRGGDGVERSLRVLEPCRADLIAERRRHAPAGAAGGEPGAVGRNLLNGREVPAKCSLELEAGDVLTVQTPGGGGYGSPMGPAIRPQRARE